MSAPNLDCQTKDYLMQFWYTHQRGRRAVSLFPDKPKGYRRATADLANYASNKATAMGCRLNGHIATAIMYEEICDRIYNKLPEWAKW